MAARDWDGGVPALANDWPGRTLGQVQGRACLALWGEVLRQAFEDARRYLRPGGRLSAAELGEGCQALLWLWGGGGGVGSVGWVCSWFDLDPAAVRQALAKQAGIRLAVVEGVVRGQVGAVG